MLPDLLRAEPGILLPREKIAADQKVSTFKKLRFQTGSHH
jgi:hypothetical protein